MSDTIAMAFSDNKSMQIVLENRISSTGLDLPIPTWFSNLRLATKDLKRPSIDDAVCNALAQYVRKINEARALRASTQRQIEDAKEEVESNTETVQKQSNTLDIEKRLFAAETSEKIWRKHANQQTNIAVSAEKRNMELHAVLKKDVEPLGKKLESLQAKLEKAQTDGDEAKVNQITGHISKAEVEVKKVEEKQTDLLAREFSILQTRAKNSQEEKQKLELELADAQKAGFDTKTVQLETLGVEPGILRGDHKILAGDKKSLEEKCVRLETRNAKLTAKHAQLDKDHALLQVNHLELQKKYTKTKLTLEKAVNMARAKQNSRGSSANGSNEQGEASTTVDKDKKRAAPKDGGTEGPKKRVKMNMKASEDLGAAGSLPQLQNQPTVGD